MASIRRTLSPLPRQGTSLNSEVGSSPLSKSSAFAHCQAPNGGVLSSALGLLDSQAFLLGVYSPRTSRPFDRSKSNLQVWRRTMLHFCICFSIGVFLGLSSLASMDFSSYTLPNHQAFSYGAVSVPETAAHNGSRWFAANSKSRFQEKEALNIISNTPMVNQSLLEHSIKICKKLLIIITPTYARPFQSYYLTRLGSILKLVEPPLLWIVVETSSQSVQTADILRRSGVMYRHLICRQNLTDVKDKSIHQKNVALTHIETHHLKGIVHFADDHNVYSVDLFEHMRGIRRFGTWVVAKLSEDGSRIVVDGPVCNGTRVIGWHTKEPFRRFRRFHAEMSGFAFDSSVLWDPERWQRPTVEPLRLRDNVEEYMKATEFIEQLVDEENQMEGVPNNCSSIGAWHLHLEWGSASHPVKWHLKSSLDADLQLS